MIFNNNRQKFIEKFLNKKYNKKKIFVDYHKKVIAKIGGF
jgi:hypothetical protein